MIEKNNISLIFQLNVILSLNYFSFTPFFFPPFPNLLSRKFDWVSVANFDKFVERKSWLFSFSPCKSSDVRQSAVAQMVFPLVVVPKSYWCWVKGLISACPSFPHLPSSTRSSLVPKKKKVVMSLPSFLLVDFYLSKDNLISVSYTGWSRIFIN